MPHSIFNKKTFLLGLIFFVLFSASIVLAGNPSSPISPNDNILDPGDPGTAWGGCGPADSNCYVATPWTNSGDDIYFNTGNVGIGTTTPTEALQVEGTALVGNFDDGYVRFDAQSGQGGAFIELSGVSPTYEVTTRIGAGGDSYFNGGFVGIGTMTPGAKLSIIGSVGNELVTNGTFTGNATGWTLGAGWTYGSNQVTHTTLNTPVMSQAVSIVVGKTYRLAYTVSGMTTGTVGVSIGDAGQSIDNSDGDGTHGFVFIAGNTAPLEFDPTADGDDPTGAFDGSIDNVSVIEILPELLAVDPDPSLNLIGLHVDKQGSVGIGTTAPTNTLSVAGDSDFDGSVTIGIPADDAAGTLLSIEGESSQTPLVGIKDQPSGCGGNCKLLGLQITMSEVTDPAATNIGLWVSATNGGDGNIAAIFENGNVGIGTTDPQGLLDVANGVNSYLLIDPANSLFQMGDISATGNETLLTIDDDNGEISLDAGSAIFLGGGLVQVGGNFNVAGNGASLIANTTAQIAPSDIGDTVLRLLGYTGGGQTADILDADGKLYVKASGNVGIGTTLPEAKLEVAGSGCFDTAADTNCTAAGTAGDIYYGTAHASWTDIAEKYPSNDSLTSGDVVMIDESAISQADTFKPYITLAQGEGTVLGVISERPGLILGDDYGKSEDYSVALSGRVPVKISNENGEIAPGDRLTISRTLPGSAMKQTNSGQSIGIALESSIAKDTVLMFINLNYQNFADLTLPPSVALDTNPGSFFDSIVAWFADVGNGIIDFFANRIHTQTLCIGEQSDETCITKTELDKILQNQNIDTTPPTGDSSPGGDTTPTPDELPISNPEAVPELIEPERPTPTVEDTPAPEPITAEGETSPEAVAPTPDETPVPPASPDGSQGGDPEPTP